MWNVWQDYFAEMKCGHELNMVAAIMADPTAQAWMNSVNVINLPANTPPQIAQNIIAAMAQNAASMVPQPPIQLNELVASIESARWCGCRSHNFQHSILERCQHGSCL